MTRSTSFAVTLLSIVVIVSPWVKAYAELQLPLPSQGGLLSDVSPVSSVAIPPPQPQCWVEALKIFQPKNNYEMETTSKVCERMGPHHQKALAFELARCHLEDLGRDIMIDAASQGDPESDGKTIADAQQCTALSAGSSTKDNDNSPHFPNLSHCLSYLTESGTNAYTLFFAQVVSLCNRLTQHMAIDFQQHTAMQLAKVSQQMVMQVTDILQNQREASQKREDEMRLRHESFYAAMQEQQEKLWEGQTSRFNEFKAWTTGMMEHWKTQAQEQKQHYEAWFINQTNLLENRSKELERLQLDKIVGAIEFLQPLLTLESWLVIAQHGFNLIVFAFQFAVVLNFVWLVTRPRRCRGSRSCLLGLVILEGSVELFTSYIVHKDIFSDSQQTAMLSSLRQTTLCLGALVYVVGLFLSCCDLIWDNEDDYDEDYENVEEDSSEEEEAKAIYQHYSEAMPEEHLATFDFPASQGRQTISSMPLGTSPLDKVYYSPQLPPPRRASSPNLRVGAESHMSFASVVSPGPDTARRPQIPQWCNKKRSLEESDEYGYYFDGYDERDDHETIFSHAAKRRRVSSGCGGKPEATTKPSMMDIDDSDNEGYYSAKEEEHDTTQEGEKWANKLHSTDDEGEDEFDEKEDDAVSMMEEEEKPVDDEMEDGETTNMDSNTSSMELVE